MNRVADIAALIVTLAGIAVLVAPSSQGPAFVKALGSAFGNAVQSASNPLGATPHYQA